MDVKLNLYYCEPLAAFTGRYSNHMVIHKAVAFVVMILAVMIQGILKAQYYSEDIRIFDYTQNIPENLLQERAAVFVVLPFQKDKPNEKESWKPLTREFHTIFESLGIDAVAYFNYDTYAASSATRQVISDFLLERKVEILVFLVKESLNETSTPFMYSCVFSAFNGETSLVSFRQSAWRVMSRDPNALRSEVFKQVYRAELDRDNHLIVDQPEYFDNLDLQSGQRLEEYPTDLRIDKLAIPLEAIQPIPEQADEENIAQIEATNAATAKKNERLKNLFADYPFEYGFIESGLSDERVWREGYTYVLESAYGPGEVLKNLLGYEVNPEETGYVTYRGGSENGIQTYSAKAFVHKYYVRHLNNKNIYVGEQWDAEMNQIQALKNLLAVVNTFQNR
jgi:hypothetical protein